MFLKTHLNSHSEIWFDVGLISWAAAAAADGGTKAGGE